MYKLLLSENMSLICSIVVGQLLKPGVVALLANTLMVQEHFVKYFEAFIYSIS